MTPYDVFSEAIQQDPRKTFRDVWCDFAIWESLRGYSDDPSAVSIDALTWVRTLNELAAQLEDFQGTSKKDCQTALEATFGAFARLNHSDELCSAVRRWREWRLEEEAEKRNAKPFGAV